jgi:hypothetical protein
MLRDFAALAALYIIYPSVQANFGLAGLFVWWNLAGRAGGRAAEREGRGKEEVWKQGGSW